MLATVQPVTSRVKERFAVSLPSEAISVIVVFPCCPTAGVIVAVQFGKVPEKTIFELGTNVVFDELALIAPEQLRRSLLSVREKETGREVPTSIV